LVICYWWIEEEVSRKDEEVAFHCLIMEQDAPVV